MTRTTNLSSRAHKSLRRNRLGLLILAALVFLGASGWWIHRTIRDTMRESVKESLTTLLKADLEALRFWMESQISEATVLADDPRVVDWVKSLLSGPVPRLLGNGAEEGTEPGRGGLDRFARDRCKAVDCIDFMVISRAGEIIASLYPEPLGTVVAEGARQSFERALAGDTSITLPYISSVPVHVEGEGTPPRRRPIMMLVAPVRSHDRSRIVAVMGLRIQPEHRFTEILTIARAGVSGETYAFDRNGLLLSDSRFDEELRELGLIGADAEGILNIEIRDPGGDLRAGYEPAVAREAQPLTMMAAAATVGRSGADVEGYRDYRGVMVVGAWTWLAEYGFGVATEEDVSEAYAPLVVLEWAFGLLFGLLVVAAGLIIFSSQSIQLLSRKLSRAESQARRMGQYTLKERIGRGGMGEVYLASHTLLRRPTAVKLLRRGHTDKETQARFEQEVQLTAALTHPNTIAIYDYGHTPDGQFYYAMEYLDGITLQELVKNFGPLGEARAIFLLRQVCGSLAEAHGSGFVHRDVKPANLFVGVQGGECDFVKVLDFGLVKSLDSNDPGLTKAGSVAGTPLYLAPESIKHSKSLDARSDLYSLGCVAYFLVTGETVFSSTDPLAVCYDHVHTPPLSPSSWLDEPLSPDFEALVLQLLAKDPQERPANAMALSEQLDACLVGSRWGRTEAAQWWEIHRDAVHELSPRYGATNERLDVLVSTRGTVDQPKITAVAPPE